MPIIPQELVNLASKMRKKDFVGVERETPYSHCGNCALG